MAQRKYNRATRDYNDQQKAQAQSRQAMANVLIAFSVALVIIVATLLGVMAIVHFYFGKQVVSTLAIVIGVLGVGFGFAWLNDRSQERASRVQTAMVPELARGMNAVIAEHARTQGAAERETVRVLGYQQRQSERVDASRQIKAQSGAQWEWEEEEDYAEYNIVDVE